MTSSVTSDDISSYCFARGRCMQSPPTRGVDAINPGSAWGRVWAQMRVRISGFVDRRTRTPTRRRVCPEDDLEVRNPWQHVGDFPKTIAARGRASSDRISGFWSWEVVEHVYGVGFIRRSLDLRKFDKLSHGLLGCLILTQHKAMVTRCRGV